MKLDVEYICPACIAPLSPMSLSTGALCWACRSCTGVLVSTSSLRREGSQRTFSSVWGALRAESFTALRKCPSCESPFRTFSSGSPETPVQLDGCSTCLVLWFDAGELERVGVDPGLATADVGAALATLEQEFTRDDQELRDTTNMLWLLAYYLRAQFQRLMYDKWLP